MVPSRALAIPILLLTASLAGCASSSGTSSASIYIKDAPSDDFREVHVIVGEVKVHRANASGDDDGWATVRANASGIDIDLLDASGVRAAFLGEVELEPGHYTQVRLVVLEAYGIDHEGERVDIVVSSGTLKVVRGFTLVEGMETQVVVDVDLDRSLREMGPNGWRMTPVIGKTFVMVVEDDRSGADVSEPGDIEEIEATQA